MERRQFIGHTTNEAATGFIGLSREITMDMYNKTIRLHDGSTPGGYPLANGNDLNNLQNEVGKQVSYKKMRSIPCSGSTTVQFKDGDEFIQLGVSDNVTITFDTSLLTNPVSTEYPHTSFRCEILLFFTNGAKTVTFASAQGSSFYYLNGFRPDFSNGAVHYFTFVKNAWENNIHIADNGIILS